MADVVPVRVHVQRSFLVAITLGFIVLLAAGSPAFALQDGEPKSEDEWRIRLRVVAGALKSAVKRGDLSVRDGTAVWTAFESEYEKSMGSAKEPEDPKQQTGVSSLRKIGDVRTLLRPEFMSRDITLLRDELDLDQSQMIVVETLLENYFELFEMVSEPLKEALRNYDSERRDRWISRALSRVNLTDDLQRSLNDALADLAEKETYLAGDDAGSDGKDPIDMEQAREKMSQYREHLGQMHDSIGDRLLRFRGEYETRLAELERPANSVTGDDLVRLARALRDERERLRVEFVEYLELIARGSDSGQLKRTIDSTIDRLRIEHNVAGGLLGGESIDLRSVVMDSELSREIENDLLLDLIEIDELIASALEERTQKRVARELVGLELKAEVDSAKDNGMGGWESLTPGDVRSYVRSCEAELNAAIQVRDLTLMYLSICAEAIRADDQAAATKFHDAGLRSGFRMETNEQWAERALRAAAELDSLDMETLETLAEIELVVGTELRALREAAITDRIRIDPIRARAMIDQMSEPGVKGADVYAEIRALFEELYEECEKINDRTEDQLLALLTPEELAQLPSRKRDDDEKKDYDKGAYGKGGAGKGGSGKGASGKGGSGKGGSGKGASGK